MRPKTRAEYRVRRHARLRQRVKGTADRPRMSVYVSNRHLYVQFVDDDAHRTLAAASSRVAGEGVVAKVTAETAKRLGAAAAGAAREKGIRRVVFDRGGFRFGARLRALADAARAAGLEF